MPTQRRRVALFGWVCAEVVAYAAFLPAYLYLVLNHLGGWLLWLFERHRHFYATVTLMLIVGQGVALQVLTTALLRLVRRHEE